MRSVVPISAEIGKYPLSGDESVDDFLSRIKPAIASSFARQSFKNATLYCQAGDYWAQLSFDDHLYSWQLGIQFYPYPDKRGNWIMAKIRTAGSKDDIGTYDPEDLYPLIERIDAALQEASTRQQ